MIVIEETGEHGGKGYNVYLAGDTERLKDTPVSQWSPAEHAGATLFEICVNALKSAGQVKTILKPGDN